MNLNDIFKIRSNVVITVMDKNGKVVRKIETHNLICNDLRTVLRRRLGVDESATPTQPPFYPVKHMWFGDDGSNLNVLNTALMHEISESDRVVTASYPDARTIKFEVTLGLADGLNDEILREAGLFTEVYSEDPDLTDRKKLYARVVFPPIEKTSAIEVNIDWTLMS